MNRRGPKATEPGPGNEAAAVTAAVSRRSPDERAVGEEGDEHRRRGGWNGVAPGARAGYGARQGKRDAARSVRHLEPERVEEPDAPAEDGTDEIARSAHGGRAGDGRRHGRRQARRLGWRRGLARRAEWAWRRGGTRHTRRVRRARRTRWPGRSQSRDAIPRSSSSPDAGRAERQ